MVKGLIYNGKNPETISSDLEVLGRNLVNLDLQQCFLPTFQLKIVTVTQKEDIEVYS